ncbi:uncharacterized protein CEXT_432971 [Caerostris extrusa]|uniref:M-phase phosphoprotein 6 n=1 Tax=Caerostris extrusa TaxID=172846 RepID=A0AAV4RQT1_CAEEX|nr:uncharacterized protein CEXT_432971 [Caerostris extrusa]
MGRLLFNFSSLVYEKSKEKSEREAEERKIRNIFETDSDVSIKGGNVYVMEPSFVPILQLVNGRFSFKGMNPEIEKLMEENEQKDPEKLKQMDGISNQVMAERYSTLINTMQKKFTPKRKWVTQKDDDDDDEIYCSYDSTKKSNKLKFRKPNDS